MTISKEEGDMTPSPYCHFCTNVGVSEDAHAQGIHIIVLIYHNTINSRYVITLLW